MNAAVIGETPDLVKFVAKPVARLMNVGIPHPGWIPGRARGRAVEAGIPHPLDLVSGFDRDRRRRKIVAARTHVDAEGPGERRTGEEKGNYADQPEDGATTVRFQRSCWLTFLFPYPRFAEKPGFKGNGVVTFPRRTQKRIVNCAAKVPPSVSATKSPCARLYCNFNCVCAVKR